MNTFTNSTAVNRIFVGVAGTGKTFYLQQLAKQYTEALSPLSKENRLALLVSGLRWVDVICLVMLDYRQQEKELVKATDIYCHDFFVAAANHRNRIGNSKNLMATIHATLQSYSAKDSKTIHYKNRLSPSFFDKDITGGWFLLDAAQQDLHQLIEKLSEYHSQATIKPTERFCMVSFHQAYGYDEFVEGIRPKIDAGQMSYYVKKGIFIELCERARKDPNHRYAMLIDEINRANITQVFGELISIIEPSKRAGCPNAMSVTLAYSKDTFSVPANLDIYATMNAEDHSVTGFDMALRRRFEFINLHPNANGLPTITDHHQKTVDLAQLMTAINQRIIETLGYHAQLGQAFFYNIHNMAELAQRFAQQILPQLIEYVKAHAIQQQTLIHYILYGQREPLNTETTQTASPFLMTHHGTTQNLQSSLTHFANIASLQIHPQLSSLTFQPDTIDEIAQQQTTSLTHSYDSIYLQAETYQAMYQTTTPKD